METRYFMGIDVYWDDDDDCIIRWDLSGYWDWDDFEQAAARSRYLRAQVSDPVAVLINIHEDSLPPNYALVHVRYAMMLAPENREMVVIVSTDPVVYDMVEMLKTLYGDLCTALLVTPSLSEAYALVGHYRLFPLPRY